MAVYQDKAKDRIAKGIRKFKSVVQKASANNAQESDTRTIVSSVASEVLGWDAFDNLTGEYRIKGTFADYVIRKDGKPFIVIEVKAISLKLNSKHLDQAVGYASRQGLEWVILTNGAEWQLHRVLFTKPVDTQLVFTFSLLSEDMKPKDKIELMYLLSAEAQRKDELEAYYQRQRSLAGESIAKLILSEGVLTRLRAEIKTDSGYRVALDELADILVNSVLRAEVCDGSVDKQLKRVQKAAKPQKKTATKQAAVESAVE